MRYVTLLRYVLPCRVAAVFATPAVRPPKGNPECICCVAKRCMEGHEKLTVVSERKRSKWRMIDGDGTRVWCIRCASYAEHTLGKTNAEGSRKMQDIRRKHTADVRLQDQKSGELQGVRKTQECFWKTTLLRFERGGEEEQKAESRETFVRYVKAEEQEDGRDRSSIWKKTHHSIA